MDKQNHFIHNPSKDHGKLSWAIDLDSTLNNLDEVWLDLYNKDYNDNMTPKDLKSWDSHMWVKPECGKKIYDYLFKPNLFRDLGIKENAKEVLSYMYQMFDIYITTAYHPDNCKDKAIWVQRQLPFFDTRKLVFINNKSMFHADFLLDDGGHNIESYRYGTPIIYDAAWNEYLGDKYKRVNDWRDVYVYAVRVLVGDGSDR